MGTSHQKGWVRIRGKKWYGYFRRTILDPSTSEPRIITHPVILGLKASMSKLEARAKLEVAIAKLGGQPNSDQSIVNGAVTLGWFVRNRYLPLKEADWREESGKVKRYLIQADFVDGFEDVRLENFDKFTLQNHLNKLAKIHSRDRVLQARSYIRSIFAEAVDQDFLPKDPARMLRVPANLREVDKTTLSWDQLREALHEIGKRSLRDWILVKLDMSNALRPSEVFPLRWRCLLEADRALDIQETLYKGKIRSYGKTKSSITQVPLADQLFCELLEYREELRRKGKDVSPDAFMFGGRFGQPMDPSNFRKRVLHKIAEKLALPKLTFQVIRRSIATLGKSKGHVKDIQGMMRHSKASTTTDIYMQSLEPEVRTAINSIYGELVRSPSGWRPSDPAASAGSGQTEALRDGVAEHSVREGDEVPTTQLSRKPTRGVVLEFAAKMRPSWKGGMTLND
ncbi:MAG: tyrosine-type recombinase/integrase [Edaphobacter sp.]|uniref:site-specific integrase n=1 Tax=Edaphobacter sp. TaxID=1934404 RepID=UPI002399840E|nr:tyrosine-type recombinase/integrase [Edaphobacter sp.]MDE1178072.1 tyrosine-type recombinase/integrase [Edaphobacter sp.]